MKVSVSNLGDYLFCPRNLYLKEKMGLGKVLSPEAVKGFLLHSARRELSLREHLILEKAGSHKAIKNFVLDEIDLILPDITQKYEEKLGGLNLDKLIPEIERELAGDALRLGERLSYLVSEAGFKKALEKVRPWKTEYLVGSDLVGLCGVVDKVVKDDCFFFPVDVKTAVPGEGVWDADKISVCAYSMLLEESLKSNRCIHSGFVDYVRIQEMRPVVNTEELKKKVFAVREEVVALLSDDVPEICPHGSGRKCESCSIKEECYEV